MDLSTFKGFHKVAYWLKSGPFLVENRSRPIKGPAPTFPGNSEEKKFL
jgi:hypothetical protein